jgi:hypothetical protein
MTLQLLPSEYPFYMRKFYFLFYQFSCAACLKVSESAGALGVDDALRDALAVKVRHLVDEGAVLDEEGAAGTHRHRVQLVRQGLPVTRGQTLRVLKIGQFSSKISC